MYVHLALLLRRRQPTSSACAALSPIPAHRQKALSDKVHARLHILLLLGRQQRHLLLGRTAIAVAILRFQHGLRGAVIILLLRARIATDNAQCAIRIGWALCELLKAHRERN